MKKKTVLCLTCVLAVLTAGCAKETTSETAAETSIEIEETVEEIQEGAAAEPVEAVIYYSNTQADGFEQKEVQLESLTPENLISELAKVNVVSVDTQVVSFEADGSSLTLDLSQGFLQYLNMMGTSGEYVVMGGLVNTFLTAYDGDEILITVEGETLETNHAIYENPLNFFEDSGESEAAGDEGEEAEPLSYRLTDQSYRQGDKIEIYYPQFTDMSDQGIQDEWNEAIREITVEAANRCDLDCSCQVDYKIASCDTEFVSFVFTRQTDTEGSSVTEQYAISFDMTERKNVRLKDWGEALDTAAYNLSNHGYYKIIDDDVDRETYDEAMKATLPTADEYKKAFLQYDFDLENLEQEPEGTSYVEDGILILIVEVPESLGGTLRIDTGIQVR